MDAGDGGGRRTFVLVHGAWHGGWCWRRVADLLERRGHAVFAPTLTGLGERSHLLSADINLDTHIADIVNLVKWERLSDCVLVAHSYGGFPVTGALERIAERVAAVVYLDAFLPADGQRSLDVASEFSRKATLEAIGEGAAGRRAPRAETFGVNERDRAWVDAKLTAHPVGVALQPIRLSGAVERVPRKAYIRAPRYPQPAFDEYFAVKKRDPSWLTYEVPCGHDVMIDMPERLCEILLEVAAFKSG